MVEGTGFENRHVRKGIEGSNPSLSANEKSVRMGAFFVREEKRAAHASGGIRTPERRGASTRRSEAGPRPSRVTTRREAKENPSRRQLFERLTESLPLPILPSQSLPCPATVIRIVVG